MTTSTDGIKKAQSIGTFTPPIAIPADANVKGMFSPVYDWPLIPLHAVMMPDGRILSYGSNADGTQTGKFIYDVWDPGVGFTLDSHTTLPNTTPTDLFCSTQIVLPAGDQIFLGGGDNWNTTVPNATNNLGNNNSNTFSVSTNLLTPGQNMNRPRWYATSTALTNGETLVAGGLGGSDAWEVRGADGSFRLLNTQSSDIGWYYPRHFVRPDGKLFGISQSGQMYIVDPTAPGALTRFTTIAPYAAYDDSAAMYRPGKVIEFGGESNAAILVDIRSAVPGVSEPTVTQTASLSSQRRQVTATIMADGKVLATGGSTVWNTMTGVNYNAETWDPVTQQWTVGATYQKARLYHSIAMLLPDGTVMVGAGGAPGPQVNTNVELYYPPYLFAGNATLAPRPTITTAPTVMNLGKSFTMQVGGSGTVTRVVMIKTGSVTHSNNMEQRFSDLPFTANGSTLTVQPPSRPGEATPGFYMIFAFNDSGVPSVAKIVRMNIGGPDTTNSPSLTPMADINGAVGTPVIVQPAAADPNGDTLSYSAAGLPPGLSINATTGAITGTPTEGGVFDVTVAVSDGVNDTTTTFAWNMTGQSPLTVSVPIQPTAVTAGSTVSFTAAAQNAVNAQYSWNFGDGSASTSYSSSTTATHTFASAGRYFVTVTAIDARGIATRQTVMQTVYLPATTQAPTASSNIALQQSASGNPLVWVVNQDNNSVSVLDGSMYSKLGEISVGASPRTLAIAPNGMVWVTNKQGSSISVINSNTYAVTTTIPLPRGSQPYGVAISPAGDYALVVLEATGQVLKFSTSTYAQIGTAVSVGQHSRHVSIASGGATAYVSDYVTPPLPGESTATVTTTGVGGVVALIDTAAMAVKSNILLAHSDKADAENQGSGIPNYLGPAVISPDGTQAWVPSKQDNIKRGTLRNGLPLNFQNTVRAISSRIQLSTNTETLASRIDHDNSSLGSGAAFDPHGNYMFVSLETSREVAVVDAIAGYEMFRITVGMAPEGLVVSPDGKKLFVNNFMDRTVTVYDLTALMNAGSATTPLLATISTIRNENLAANILLGKQLFYDARDPRLARDRYMSCASCHNDGESDGRVWDFTSLGEGLRNSIQLRGRAGMAEGNLHWSGNFDEVQDFEGQIRTLNGGTGLMTDAQFNTGTRSQPLGDPKAGVSSDLDALAAYMSSLTTFDISPLRNADASLTTSAAAGKTVFLANCASCHSGGAFTDSVLRNVGTIKPSSGQRLGGPLTGIDTPTLRDVWLTSPYLHDGSASTVEAAIQAHNNFTLSSTDLTNVANYVRQLGSDEVVDATGIAPTARYVKLEAVSEVNGQPYTSMAEFNLLDSAGNTMSRTNWVVSADSAESDAPATNAIDGLTTIWHTQWRAAQPPLPHAFSVDMGATAQISGFRYLPRQDGATVGQILGYNFYTSPDGVNWTLAARGTFDTSSAEKKVAFAFTANHPPVLATVANQVGVIGTVKTLALSATDADGDTLGYAASGLPPGLVLNTTTGVITGTPTTAGTYTPTVGVADGKGGSATQTFTWTVTATAVAPTARYAKLQAITAQDGGPFASMAEFNLLDGSGNAMTRTAWAVSADSAESDAPATNAIDGQTTIWHTQWRTAQPPLPHAFTVDLGTAQAISGFRYLPRQDGATAGLILGYNFFTSTDGVTWTLSASGTFDTSTAEKKVTIAAVANHAPVLATVANQVGVIGTAKTLTLSATDADGDTLGYAASGLPAGLTLNTTTGVISGTPTTAGTYTPTVGVADGKGGSATQTFTWTVTATAVAPTARYAKLQALTAQDGGPFASMAEFNLLDASGNAMTRTAWAVSADSAESDAPATNAIDGQTTIWHTQWRTAQPPLPHAFTVDMGSAQAIGGFRYLPRQDGGTAGLIVGYNFFTSTDGVTWTLSASGTFDTSTAEKKVTIATIANHPPVLATVANQVGVIGTATSLSLSATDADGDTLGYAASGLPAGLTLNTTTGVISGTPTTAGTYTPTLGVADGKGGSATQTITWTVTATAVAPTARYAKLESISSVDGGPFASMAEFNVLDASGNAMGRTGWVVSADSAESDAPPANAIDGLTTIWHTQWRTAQPPLPHAFTVDLGSAQAIGGFRYLPRQDGGTAGMILGYNFYTSTDGVTWTRSASGTFDTGTTEKKVTIATIANHAPVLATVANQAGVIGTATSLSLSATDADGDTLGYAASGLPAGVTINTTTGVISGTPTTAGTYTPTVGVADGKGGSATQTITWTVTATAVAPTARYAKLEAISSVNGQPFASMAEFNLLDGSGNTMTRTSWAVSADSFESDAPPANAIDGQTTIWHTQWRTAQPPLPHAFTVDMGSAQKIGGFRVLPRQDGGTAGLILGYNFYTSTDGVTWTRSAAGSFDTGTAEKKVTISTSN